MARWMGYANADEMNAEHDPLHAQLAQWVGVTSFSLMEAQGIPLTLKQRRIAELEEGAVLHLQRWIANLRQEGLLPCSVIF